MQTVLLLVPLPNDRGPALEVRIRPSALPWKLPELTHVAVVAEDGKQGPPQPVARQGDTIIVECQPGVFGYRLFAK